MTEKQIIESLMLKAAQVRQAQNTYFRQPNATNRRISMGLETSLDKYLQQLRRLGYKPESQQSTTEQNKLF